MQDLVEILTGLLKEKGWKMVAAESCTGGLLSAAITHRPGASDVFERGFITYSNEAKMESLKVAKALLDANGAVSGACAEAMARGALNNSRAQIAISVTGVAGPDGGTDKKPVGLVYIGHALKSGATGSSEFHFIGNREQIRGQAAVEALKQLIKVLERER